MADLPYFGTGAIPNSTIQGLDEVDPITPEGTSFARLQTNTDSGGDRYVIESEIARGGHAVVFRAFDQRLQRPVALKQLRTRVISETRFLNEALITARLRHPGIVPIYDIDCWADGTPFFAMELVSGETLGRRITDARSRRDRMALLSSVIAAADAVAYAHSQRIVHRDLKPSNILVSDFGETIVIDWGIATLVEDVSRGVSPRSAVVGTPNYMSPEQAAGVEIDARADVYALGAIVYHLIAGRPPFCEVPASEIIGRVRRGEAPRSLADAFPGLSRSLVSVVERAMAPDPDKRYRSAAELRDDLADFRRASDRAA